MNSMLAFVELSHNGDLIKKAEHILNEFAGDKNTYLHLENPDGTRIRIHPGCKIKYLSWR